MFRIFIFLMLSSCAFKSNEEVIASKAQFAEFYYSETEFAFLSKSILSKGKEGTVLNPVRWLDAQSNAQNEFPLGNLNPSDELHFLISPKMFFGTQPKKFYSQESLRRSQSCYIEATKLEPFSNKLQFAEDFTDTILQKIKLKIDENEYSIKSLYEENQIDTQWIDLFDDGVKHLYIAINNFYLIKNITEGESVSLKLYPIKNSIFEGVKIMSWDRKADPFYSCVKYGREMANLYQLKIAFEGVKTQSDLFYQFPRRKDQTSNELAEIFIIDLYLTEEKTRDYFKYFSLDIRSIIFNQKEVLK